MGWYSTLSRSDYTMLLTQRGESGSRKYPMHSGGFELNLPSIGQSPYILVYGSEAILPADVMWESLAVEQYDEGISEDNIRVDIDGPEEARCAALVQSARYLEGI
jgi:hypothetical protein